MNLESKRVLLRLLRPEDAKGNYPNWLNDKKVCKHNSHGNVFYTKELALKYIKEVRNNPAFKTFAIIDKKSKRHIGNISLQQIDIKNKKAELAILIGEKDFWGKGYAKEAGKLILNFGFDYLKLDEIYCGTSENNIAMQKLALSLGMKKTKIKIKNFYKNGIYLDTFYYSIFSFKI